MSETDEPLPEQPARAHDERRAWHEGPEDDAPPESWLSLDDDELLHRIETVGEEEDADDQLMEVVCGTRHFFVRQEAAKRVRDRSRLFPFEDDRYIGQILVRRLNRREDLTYLERLVERSHHVEVRAAAQVQLAQLWGRLGGPSRTLPAGGPALPPPEFREAALEPFGEGEETPVLARGGKGRVDATLLGWALHFVVEEAWAHLGTPRARGLLRRTHGELLPRNPSLGAFRVEDDAHVSVDLGEGSRLPPEAVDGVAAWIVAFLQVAGQVAEEAGRIDVRVATRLMADALERYGFYAALDYAGFRSTDA